MPIALTDAEQRFADSPAGRAALARAKMIHDAANLGPAAEPWTDALAADATRALVTLDARSRVETAAMAAALPSTLAVADAERITAHVLMVRDLATGNR